MPTPKPRANNDGTVSWTVQYRVDGKVVRDTFVEFGPADEYCRLIDTVGGAQARKVLGARRVGNYTPTLRAWVETYLDEKSGILTGIEAGTREGYQLEAERTFLPFLGHYPINALDRDIVGQWVTWQEKQTVWRDRKKEEADRQVVSAKTVKNAHSLLSAVLAAAVERKHIDHNPARGVRVSKGTKREAVFLSPDEFETILHFLPEHHRPLVLFLAGTGCRWGEATAMTWGDVTLHATPPTVRVTKAWKRGKKGGAVLKHPKSSKARRTISIFDTLVNVLGKPGPSDQYLFRGATGNRVRHQNFSDRIWNRAIRKAMDKELCAAEGMVPVGRQAHIHDLRHTHASWLIARGVPLPYIQARLGHEKITTTVDTYGHLVPEAHEQMATAVKLTLAGTTSLTLKALPVPEDDEPELEFDGDVSDDD